MTDSTSTFDQAAARVAAGADPRAEASAIVAAMTPAEVRDCLDGDHPCWAGLGEMARGGYHNRPFPASRIARLGVPGFAFSDGPRGCVIGHATAFPVTMARGATWDVELEERIGDAIGRELRAIGADLYGGVCVNVLRHPAWGRAQETYGEDPYLLGEMGAALTRGVQRHAMATVKHFALNSMENARFQVDVTVDEVALHEVYLPHFRRIVEEGVACVMSAYNAVNGEWCGQHAGLLTDVLRGEWGFEGMVISDWIFGLRDAGRSVVAGLDVEMPARMIRSRLDADLAAGACTEADLAAAATRVVATLLRWHEVLSTPAPPIDILACPEHRALAREAATAAIVLLRNEPVTSTGVPVLPLDPAGLRRVAVLGRLAAVRNLGDGGSSDVWAPEVVTALDGLRAALGDSVEVLHDDGSDAAAAATLAASCDVALVVAGYTKADEGEFIGNGPNSAELASLFPGPDDPDDVAAFQAELAAETLHWEHPAPDPEAGVGFSTGGDRTSLRLHPEDAELIRAVGAAQPRTVVAIVAGSAVIVEEWVEAVPAVVQAWYSGMEGGHALADVLLGRAEPSGRLPFSVPTDEAHLPHFDRDATAITYDLWHGYWQLRRDGHDARFPFGFGLSYTSLAIEEASAAVEGDALVARATVANSGERAGVEVVQVFAAVADRPSRLVGFARRELAAGERAEVEVRVPLARLELRDPATHSWAPASGPVALRVARHAADPDAHLLDVHL